MKSIHVFCRVDREQNLFGIYLRREWQLHENSVNLIPAVKLSNQRKQFISRYVG